jgi:hypothetical protein
MFDFNLVFCQILSTFFLFLFFMFKFFLSFFFQISSLSVLLLRILLRYFLWFTVFCYWEFYFVIFCGLPLMSLVLSSWLGSRVLNINNDWPHYFFRFFIDFFCQSYTSLFFLLEIDFHVFFCFPFYEIISILYS